MNNYKIIKKKKTWTHIQNICCWKKTTTIWDFKVVEVRELSCMIQMFSVWMNADLHPCDNCILSDSGVYDSTSQVSTINV